MFVKEHIHQFKHLPAKQRMGAVAELYHKQKSGASAMPAKKGRGRPKKGGAMTAGSFLGDVYKDVIPFGNLLGLGLEDGGASSAGALHKKKPSKKGGIFTASGLGDGGALSAGALHKKRGRPSKKGGIFTASGLGDGGALSAGALHKKRGRPSKKGGIFTASGLGDGGALSAGAFHGTSPTKTGAGWSDDFKKGFQHVFQAIGHTAPAIAHLI